MSKAYEAITDQILVFMQRGTCPWRRPWNSQQARPRNIEGRPYRGCNWFLLGFLPFENPIYLTFQQAKRRGGSVKKGEKGFPVLFWRMLPVQQKNEDGSVEDVLVPMARVFTVFNIAQTTLEQPASPEPTAAQVFDPLEAAEAILANMPQRPAIRTAVRAFYHPATDEVTMPARHLFPEATGFYDTLFHELGHSTGHASRLNRKEVTQPIYFGSHDYSLEELVAELTSAFLCAEAGIDNQRILENQAAYCKGWLAKLKDDPKLFITAAARAQKAADFILNHHAESQHEERAPQEQAA